MRTGYLNRANPLVAAWWQGVLVTKLSKICVIQSHASTERQIPVSDTALRRYPEQGLPVFNLQEIPA